MMNDKFEEFLTAKAVQEVRDKLTSFVDKALSSFNASIQEILALQTGVQGWARYSQNEIYDLLSKASENVHVVKQKALAKLEKPVAFSDVYKISFDVGEQVTETIETTKIEIESAVAA